MKTPPLSPRFANLPGAQAAHRLFEACGHVGGSTHHPIAGFLTSLYNSRYEKPNAYLLCRRISDTHFDDVLAVMQWFHNGESRPSEIQEIFGPGGTMVMTDLMSRFGFWPLQYRNEPDTPRKRRKS
jgi:hypothetical protein